MKREDIINLIPKDKFDESTLEKLMAISEEDIQIIFPDLLNWLADFNWPIAKHILKVVTKFPNTLVPHLKNLLKPYEVDDGLKYWVVIAIIPKLSISYQLMLLEDIERICKYPTESEKYEEIIENAKELYDTLKIESERQFTE